MGLCHHDKVGRFIVSQKFQKIIYLYPIYSYTWTIPSIIGDFALSRQTTVIVLTIVFFPLVLALGMGCAIFYLGFLAVVKLRDFGVWLYHSPPMKWSIRHLGWPLRITWFALKGIVPSCRYMYRARLKWILMEESVSASLDLEKGRRRASSSSGSIASMAEPHRARIESRQPRQAGGGAESSIESFSNVAPTARICGHGNDWHCRTCGTQACFRCSVEISNPPPTTRHFFCEPRCSRCYLNTMCGGVLPRKKQKTPCSHRQDRCKLLPTPRVCRSCAEDRGGGDAILRRLGELEREELWHLARQNLKCGVCETRLGGNGPRWWTCCDCNQECDSELHPPWSKVPE